MSEEVETEKQEKITTDELEVGTIRITELFNSGKKISLPDYQRPYVWNEEKLEQLINDLEEHFNSKDDENSPETSDKKFPILSEYYLGTILLHKTGDDNYHIIDGQQRISTLLLLDYAWNEDKSYLKQGKWNLQYTSLISAAALKQNYQFLRNHPSRKKYKVHLQDILSHLVVSVIVTPSEDESFIFFDSQNNRGVKLSAVDFLKSYHLRELKHKEDLQRIFARRWDKNNTGQFLKTLFNLILWRSRTWKGTDVYYEYKDAILNTFQKKTIKLSDNEIVRLYPNTFNTLAESLEFSSQFGVSIRPGRLNLQTMPEQYPFSLRQPIQRGIGFLLYTEKYHSIYHTLFTEERFNAFSKIYRTLYNGVSYYLKTFFKLASVCYYDKFKEEKLEDFGLWFDYLLGSYRVNQHTIVAQTVVKILKGEDKPQNLLDVIEMAYRPEDVFEFMKSITNKSFYARRVENYGSENGVKNRYRKNNIKFFEKKDPNITLEYKLNWINERLNNK